MDTSDLFLAWQARYENEPPVGFLLTASHRRIWTRIHYLPGAARPARTIGEQATVVERLGAVADAVFGGAHVSLIAIHFDHRDQELELLAPVGAATFVPPTEWISALEESFADPSLAEFAHAQVAWRSGLLDDLWLACALDRIGRVAVFDPLTGNTMCPYDGGADLFVWDQTRRLEIRKRFADWLPDDGLPGSPDDLEEST